MSSPVSTPWSNLFKGVSQQNQAYQDDPISPSGNYYAFLSKADLDAGAKTKSWEVLFELVSQEWMDSAVNSRPIAIDRPMPPAPALLYALHDVDEATLLKALGLKTTDDLAEGSWYLLNLSPSKSKALQAELGEGTGISGDLFDPDIDSIGPS